MINKKVVIFGVFDGIHEGHSFLIREAKKQGNQLVAIVARDEIVKILKGKLPILNEVERINELLKIEDIDLVLLGDPEMETYNTLKEVNPDIIYLGYDQKELLNNVNKFIKIGYLPKMEIMIGESHKPDIFHSSIIKSSKAGNI